MVLRRVLAVGFAWKVRKGSEKGSQKWSLEGNFQKVPETPFRGYRFMKTQEHFRTLLTFFLTS